MHSKGAACAGAALVCGLVLTLCTACGGTTSVARSALRQVDDVLDVAAPQVDDLMKARKSLEEIPPGSFSADDLARRDRLLSSSDTFLAEFDSATLRSAADAIDTRFANYLPELQTGTDGLVAQTLTPSVYSSSPGFKEELEEVTRELVVDAACQQVFDTIVPDERPKEPGLGSDWVDAGSQAIVKLVARRWTQETFVDTVDWTYYAQSITDQGQQLAASTREAPDSDIIVLLSQPSVKPAVLQYLRLCYSPPRMPG
jgi:hypothetical protein